MQLCVNRGSDVRQLPKREGWAAQAKQDYSAAGFLAAARGRALCGGGQGAVLIPIDTGDQITIINDEGGQHCEVVVCDPKGRSDAGLLV